MKYFQTEQYYIDRYDIHTIEECLKWYWNLKDKFEKHRNDKNFKKFTKQEFNIEVHKVVSYAVNAIKIERHRSKEKKIKEWIDNDKSLQESFDNAVPPSNIKCPECRSKTKVVSKNFFDSDRENSQVLFMFECKNCKKKLAIFEDGTEWVYQPPKCPKCKIPLKHETNHIDDNMITNYSCKECEYKETDTYDFKKSDEERKNREQRDQKLLAEYRDEFCFNDEQGAKAVQGLDQMARFVQEMKDKEKKMSDPLYKKANQLKRLKVSQLKELVEQTVTDNTYIDLQFGKPELGQHVIIEFTVYDKDENRSEYDSKNTLKKIINSILANTTWRLMSDGVSYRLGILSGRLKAYEQEDELVKLITNNAHT